MSRVGLVVGKFCPLHRGHQALIEFATARCDRLILISYTNPDFPGCSTEQRRQWLKGIYPDATRLVVDDHFLAAFSTRTGTAPRRLPHNDAAEVDHRTFVAWLCLTVLQTTVDAVFTSEAYGDAFAAELTAIFQAEAGYRGSVAHIAFDPGRSAVPVSGTAIRADPWTNRAFISDAVAASFVKRIALLGGELSGKSTLAAALAHLLGTLWVHEYGRELTELRAGQLEFDDLLAIGEEQVEREEDALLRSTRWLFCDTTPLVTAFYSQSMFGRIDPALEVLALRRYDYSLLCAPDFPFVQDGSRRDAWFRQEQHDWYVERLGRMNQPYALVAGTIAERLHTAQTILTRYFGSP